MSQPADREYILRRGCCVVCKSHSRSECLAVRYNIPVDERDGEECECSCHDLYEAAQEDA